MQLARQKVVGGRSAGRALPQLLAAAAACAALQSLTGAFLAPAVSRHPLSSGLFGTNGLLLGRLPARGTLVSRAAEGLSVGDAVEAVFEDDGNWYPGTVEKANKDGSFVVKWDNPDGGPETSTINAENIKKYVPPIPLDQLQFGQKLTGKVISTASFGAFVDVGAEKQGLVHVSCLSDGFVSNVDDHVQAGQEVTVWVKGTNDGKLSLTMVESKLQGGAGGGGRAPRAPRAPADLSAFSVGDQLTGTVISITGFGCFVSVVPPNGGAAQQGLVHVSQMADGYVSNPADVVSQGQEVNVRVTNVDTAAGKLSLSMKSE
jgi:predicted RNA-binding protein with RPS1 domain